MKKVAIKGDGTSERGNAIIDYFDSLGVENPMRLTCNRIYYYFNSNLGYIDSNSELPDGYTLIPLPEEKETPEQRCNSIVQEVMDTSLKAMKAMQDIHKIAEIIKENKALKAENEHLTHQIKKAKLILENLFDE